MTVTIEVEGIIGQSTTHIELHGTANGKKAYVRFRHDTAEIRLADEWSETNPKFIRRNDAETRFSHSFADRIYPEFDSWDEVFKDTPYRIEGHRL